MCYAERRVLKLLSEDPGNYPDAPREGIRRVLEEVTGQPHPRDAPLDTSNLASIRMGTTVCSGRVRIRVTEAVRAFVHTVGCSRFKQQMSWGLALIESHTPYVALRQSR